MKPADEHPEQVVAGSASRAGATDVFLSYSRHDRDFVRWLHAALVQRGKDVYVDWEDIPDWSSDYESDLEAAILATDAFVFVLSPASVESANCRRELEFAVAGGKRIRPVVHRPVANQAVPPALRKPQWLDLSSPDDEAVAKLVAALDVDPEWVQAHTRLLVRAQEWERRGRDGSFLLHGSDLREAEGWLAGQAGRDPPPTPLQADFVLASRRGATRRQRITLGAVLAALIVAVALAAFAFVQRSRAIRDGKVAHSRELAALSLGASSSDARRVLDLALRAVDEAETPEAEDALRQALVRSREVGNVEGATQLGASFVSGDDRAVFICGDGRRGWLFEGVATACRAKVSPGPYKQSAFSANGRHALEVGEASSRVIETTTGAVLGTVPVPAAIINGADGAAVTPDGRRVLTLGEDHAARLWALPAHPGPAKLRWQRGGVDGIALSPDGRRFVTGDQDGVVRIWDSVTARRIADLHGLRGSLPLVAIGDSGIVVAVSDSGVALWTLARPRARVWIPDAVYAVASRDGRLFAVEYRSGRVEVRKVAQPAETIEAFRASPGLVDFSPDGSQIVVVGDRGAEVWSTRTARQLGFFPSGATIFFRATVSRDGRFLLTESFDYFIRLWRISPTPLLARVRVGAPPNRGADRPVLTDFAFDGTRVTTALDDGTVRIWEWQRTQPVTLRVVGRFGDVALGSNGRFAAGVDREKIRIWNTRSRRVISTVRARQAFGTVFSPDGQRVAAALRDGTIGIWNTADGREVRVLRSVVVLDTSIKLVLSPMNDRLAVSAPYSRGARLVDLDSDRPIPLRLPAIDPADVAFSPDGTLLAVAVGNEVRIHRADDGTQFRVIKAHKTPLDTDEDVLSATFSPDSRRLLISGNDDTIRLLNVATGEEQYLLNGPNTPKLSADGAVFAAHDRNSIVIWSTTSGKRLAAVHESDVGFSFSPDGSRLMTADPNDGELRVFGCDACGAVERLRALAHKRLGTRAG